MDKKNMDKKNMDKNVYKIVLIGDSGVGKSSIAYWLLQNKRSFDSSSTIGAAFLAKDLKVPIKNKEGLEEETTIKLHVWDTAGQERFRAIARMYYKNTAGCLCVFDLTNRQTFLNLNYWLRDYKEYNYNSKSIIILVANKSDYPEPDWEVKMKEIIDFANANEYVYVFTNCIDGAGIQNAFKMLARLIIENHQSMQIQENDLLEQKVDTSIITDLTNKTKNLYNTEKCCYV